MIVSVFGFANAVLRRVASPSLAMDDAKTNVFTQVWQWGYQPDNPPLYEWLLKLVQPLTGAGLEGFLLLKYACLSIAAMALHLLVRAYASDRVAFGTTVGMVLLYQVGWNFHQAFTHSALLVAAVAVWLWAALRWWRAPGLKTAALLGMATAIAMMSKYNAGLLVAGFFVALASSPFGRGALGRPTTLLIPLMAILALLPHGLWFLAQTEAYRETLDVTLGLEGSHLSRVGEGLGSLFISAVTFMLPWGLVYGALGRGLRPTPLLTEERLLIQTSLWTLGGLAVAVIAFGIGNVSERYLIPVLLPCAIGLTSHLLRRPKAPFGPWISITAAMAVLVLVLRAAAYLMPGPPFCDECRQFVPYAVLAEDVRDHIPEGAILLVREENTGGNMVTQFPTSPVRVMTSLPLMNPIEDEGRPCFYLWSEGMVGGHRLQGDMAAMYDHQETVVINVPWQHPLKPAGWRQTKWALTPLNDETLYKNYCVKKKSPKQR